MIIDQVYKFQLNLQNPIGTGLLRVRCNFDAGETLLRLCVFNPEGYGTFVWTQCVKIDINDVAIIAENMKNMGRLGQKICVFIVVLLKKSTVLDVPY